MEKGKASSSSPTGEGNTSVGLFSSTLTRNGIEHFVFGVLRWFSDPKVENFSFLVEQYRTGGARQIQRLVVYSGNAIHVELLFGNVSRNFVCRFRKDRNDPCQIAVCTCAVSFEELSKEGDALTTVLALRTHRNDQGLRGIAIVNAG